jgi:sulfate permease, SulP family
VPAALGVANPKGENTAAIAVRAAARVAGDGRMAAVMVVALVIAVMVLAPRLHRSLPASLLAVAVATVVAEAAGLDVARIGALPHSLPAPSWPDVSFEAITNLLGAALAVAALAAIESLLSAEVADGMADAPRHEPDRELFGQGLANIVSPLFGGMPATGAIARTAVNVRAGARTRVAGIVHALVLLLVVLFAGDLVSRIPLAALAGVLMMTAVRMIEVRNVRSVLRSTRSDAFVLVITAGTTIAFDLILAVEVGVAVAALLALRNMARSSTVVPVGVEVGSDTEAELLHHHIVAYRIDGAMFFGAAQRFLTELTAVSDVRVVILRLPDMQMLDATGARALGDVVAELERRGMTVLLKGLRAEHQRLLAAVGALDHLANENHIFEQLDDAVAHAELHVARGAHAL